MTASAGLLVIDASAVVDLLLPAATAGQIATRVRNHELRAPAHLDVEVLSALGRLQRSGMLAVDDVEQRLVRLAALPVARTPLVGLLTGAWRRRESLRLADALYVELAEQLGTRLVTTDLRLGRVAPAAEVVPRTDS